MIPTFKFIQQITNFYKSLACSIWQASERDHPGRASQCPISHLVELVGVCNSSVTVAEGVLRSLGRGGRGRRCRYAEQRGEN
eukprot:242370-Hanusia_phi.AAC.2